MKTNYIGHDELYKLRKAKGWQGWGDAETIKSNLRTLDEELRRDFVPNSGRVLELGCGAGGISLQLATEGYVVHGIDIAPSAIAWAKEKATSQNIVAEFQVGDVRTLEPFADEAFDIVLDGHCLHCIVGEHRDSLLQSAKRVLKKGGLLFLKTMCGDIDNSNISVSSRLRESYDASTRCLINDGVHTRYIGMPDDIVQEVRTAGFQVLTSRIQHSNGELDHMDELLLWAKK